MADRAARDAPHLGGAAAGRAAALSDSRETFWGWPPPPVRALFARCFVAVSVLFGLVYVGADALTARRVQGRVDLPWEARVPFVPAMVWIYSSIYLVFVAAPLVLRREREIRALSVALSAVTVAGGAGFLLWPSRLAYPPAPLETGALTAALMRLSDRVNLTYNLVPSLHVALSATTLGAMATRARWAGRAVTALLAGLIGLSTMLTHQHHLVDVVAGYAVAAAALAFVYRPLSAGSCAPDVAPSNTAGQPSSGLRASGLTSPRR